MLTRWLGMTPQVDTVCLQSQQVLASMKTSSCQSEAAMLPWSVAQTKGLLSAGLQGRISRHAPRSHQQQQRRTAGRT